MNNIETLMANPKAIIKALRLMKSQTIRIPIVTYPFSRCLSDKPEERGQGEAIARNILEMMSILCQLLLSLLAKVPLEVHLGSCWRSNPYLENTWYSVITVLYHYGGLGTQRSCSRSFKINV